MLRAAFERKTTRYFRLSRMLKKMSLSGRTCRKGIDAFENPLQLVAISPAAVIAPVNVIFIDPDASG